jgi:hypothetical protein
MNDFIDIYCERTAPGLWAEPLNAASNFAFFIAAYCAWKLARKENAAGPPTAILVFLLLCIGAGSTLFHTLATGWAQLADTLPILLFQIAFLAIYAQRVLHLKAIHIAALLLAFFATIYGFAQLPQELFNGSISYAPALVFLSIFAFVHARKQKAEPYVLAIAVLVFAVSLSLRSLDMAVCEAVPIGLHYFWHVLNAVVLYLSLRALIVNTR